MDTLRGRARHIERLPAALAGNGRRHGLTPHERELPGWGVKYHRTLAVNRVTVENFKRERVSESFLRWNAESVPDTFSSMGEIASLQAQAKKIVHRTPHGKFSAAAK